MSRARAKAKRLKHGSYQTDRALALAICADLKARHIEPVEIIEPSCGYGSFVAAAAATWPQAVIFAVDIQNREKAALRSGASVFAKMDTVDFAREWKRNTSPDGKQRLWIGNPDYAHAQEHIEAINDAMNVGDVLCFLLRMGIYESYDRVAMWKRWRAQSVSVLIPRPSFTFGGTDGAVYAVVRWCKGFAGKTHLTDPMVWRAKRARKESKR